eukprot:1157979-Pelagomonas_calceolata.AAC.6
MALQGVEGQEARQAYVYSLSLPEKHREVHTHTRRGAPGGEQRQARAAGQAAAQAESPREQGAHLQPDDARAGYPRGLCAVQVKH